MTVSYLYSVSTSRAWTFFKLLFKWRGSVWKAVLFDLIAWMVVYAIISIVYRTAFSANSQRVFEEVIIYFENHINYIPLNFMLGFYVTAVVNRWQYLFTRIGFIQNVGLMISEHVRGHTFEARLMRRSMARYCELSQILVFRAINSSTNRRFPTMDSLVESGFMMAHERPIFEEVEAPVVKFYKPCQWAMECVYDARRKGYIESDYFLEVLGKEIAMFRAGLAKLMHYNALPIPIMYTQLVVLAVHIYFTLCLLSRQFLLSGPEIDIYVPVMTIIQFVFYVGWLRVAAVMLNPFGEDDDDFECNALIDRNIKMVLMMVDQGHNSCPPMEEDAFWNKEVEPLYSQETANLPNHPQRGSFSDWKLSRSESKKVKMVPHHLTKRERRDLESAPAVRQRASTMDTMATVRREFSRIEEGSENDETKSEAHEVRNDVNIAEMFEGKQWAQVAKKFDVQPVHSQDTVSLPTNSRRGSVSDLFKLTRAPSKKVKMVPHVDAKKHVHSIGGPPAVRQRVSASMEVLPHPRREVSRIDEGSEDSSDETKSEVEEVRNEMKWEVGNEVDNGEMFGETNWADIAKKLDVLPVHSQDTVSLPANSRRGSLSDLFKLSRSQSKRVSKKVKMVPHCQAPKKDAESGKVGPAFRKRSSTMDTLPIPQLRREVSRIDEGSGEDSSDEATAEVKKEVVEEVKDEDRQGCPITKGIRHQLNDPEEGHEKTQ